MVRNYISMVAEALGCARRDYFQEFKKLHNSEAIAALSRPVWGCGAQSPAGVGHPPWCEPVETTNSLGMRFVLIPAGEFDMGSTLEEVAWTVERIRENKDSNPAADWWIADARSEAPRHRVKIGKPFWLGVTEVTQRDYETVMKRNPGAHANQLLHPTLFTPPLSESELEYRSGRSQSVANLDTSQHRVETVSCDQAVEFCRRLSAMAAERSAGCGYSPRTSQQ